MGRNRRKHRNRRALLREQSGDNGTRGSRNEQPDVAAEFCLEGFHHEGFSHGGFSPDDFVAIRRAVAMSSFIFQVGLVHQILASSQRSPRWEREEFFRDSSDESAAEGFRHEGFRREGFRHEGYCHGGSCHSRIHGSNLLLNENIMVVSRKDWNAKKPKQIIEPRVFPFAVVFVGCFNGNIFPHDLEVIKKMQAMQSHQMEYLDDILCHFVVANDGKIYEGRGWDIKGVDEKVIHIDFIVKSVEDVPSKEELDECKKIIKEGVRLSKICKDYCLITRKDHRLYDELVSWDNFSPSGCP